jgi:hypothetical protein
VDGLYYWRVRAMNAVSQPGTWSASRTFTIDNIAPLAPVLSLPANAATVVASPTFSWVAAATATKYQFQYATDTGFSAGLYPSGELTTLNHTPTLAMVPGTYYWRVQAGDAAGNWSAYSAPRTVTILAAPVLTAPENALATKNRTPLFTWDAVVSGSTYQLQIAKTAAFTAPLTQFYSGPLTSYPATSLVDGLYYWRVRAMNAVSQPGTWSASRTFTVDNIAPLAPVLSLPANAATVVASPTFSWVAAATATKYQFQYATDTGFSAGLYTSGELTTLNHTPTPAMVPGTYYWRAQAGDAAGNWSAYSAPRTINIILVAPTLNSPANGSISQNPAPALSWTVSADADHYWVQMDNNSTFSSPEFEDDSISLNTITPSPLVNGVYYWRVQAINSLGGTSAWSTVWRVTINQPIPPAPALLLPADASTSAILSLPADAPMETTGTPTFEWNPVTYGENYQIQVATDNLFSVSSTVFDNTAANTSRVSTFFAKAPLSNVVELQGIMHNLIFSAASVVPPPRTHLAKPRSLRFL